METGRRDCSAKATGPTLMYLLSIRSDSSAAEIPQRSEGPQAHTGLPSPGLQSQDEEFPQNLAMKNSRNFIHQSEMEGCWKPRCPLIRQAHRLTCSQALIMGFCRGMTVQEAPETFRERLGCMA